MQQRWLNSSHGNMERLRLVMDNFPQGLNKMPHVLIYLPFFSQNTTPFPNEPVSYPKD